MIYTYRIVGYSLEAPFISRKTENDIKLGLIRYSDIPNKVKLLLINVDDGSLCTKFFGYFRNGKIYHKCGKGSNYFKFERAINGIRDNVKTYLLDFQIKDFIGKYLSYNDIYRTWVKAPKSRIKEVNPDLYTLQFYLFYLRNVKCFLLPSIYSKIVGDKYGI